MADDKCPFQDIEYVNFRDGGRFDTPSRRERRHIVPGHLVRLCYRDVQGVEYLWAEVDERTADGYRGRLDSSPVSVSFGSIEGDVVHFGPQHVLDIYKRKAPTATASYTELLADAEALETKKYWAPVLKIEQTAMEERVPPNMRGPEGAERRADYLRTHPHCIGCEARGSENEAVYPVYRSGQEAGDDDSNLDPFCHICLYVLTARAMGWPVRGCDVKGMPNDPNHPWNAEG